VGNCFGVQYTHGVYYSFNPFVSHCEPVEARSGPGRDGIMGDTLVGFSLDSISDELIPEPGMIRLPKGPCANDGEDFTGMTQALVLARNPSKAWRRVTEPMAVLPLSGRGDGSV